LVLFVPPPDDRQLAPAPTVLAQNAFASLVPGGRSAAAQLTKQ
jgi:hypothetical protein